MTSTRSTTAAKADGITPSTASAHIITTPLQSTFEPARVEANTTASVSEPSSIPAAPGSLPSTTSASTLSMMDETTTPTEGHTSPREVQPTPTPTTSASASQPGPTPTSGRVYENENTDPAPPTSAADPSILNQRPTQTSQVQPTPSPTASSSFIPPQAYYSPPEATFRGQPTSTASPYQTQPNLYSQQQQQSPYYSSGTDGNAGYYQQQTNTSRPMDYGMDHGSREDDKKEPGILGKITQVVDSVNQWMVGDNSGKGPSA